MESSIFSKIFIGGLLIIIGVILIFFHEQIRKFNDSLNAVLLGSMWTGKYTREALLFLKTVSTALGIVLVLFGLGIILNFIH